MSSLHALEIYQAGIHAVMPESLIMRAIQRNESALCVCGDKFDLNSFQKIYVAGAGKASAAMAMAIEKILGAEITDGIIAIRENHDLPLQYIQTIEAAHPIPDKSSVEAGKKIKELFGKAADKDLIIFLLSGGASSLLTDCPDGISLEDIQITNSLLLKSGANINEVNCVRKHLSEIKGGQLAILAKSTTIITLIISDVIENSLSVIGSGPTVMDETCFDDALSVLSTYQLEQEIPNAILHHLKKGKEGLLNETPKPRDNRFEHVHNYIIGDNRIALQAAATKATALGYDTKTITYDLSGEASLAGKHWMKEVINNAKGHDKICLLAGGETTVTVRGKGTGGRNQEFALICAMEIPYKSNITILSAGTDGIDGPTDVAGAMVTNETLYTARKLHLDPESYLRNNDSYHFFKKAGGHIKTGVTHTNVMDIVITLINK